MLQWLPGRRIDLHSRIRFDDDLRSHTFLLLHLLLCFWHEKNRANRRPIAVRTRLALSTKYSTCTSVNVCPVSRATATTASVRPASSAFAGAPTAICTSTASANVPSSATKSAKVIFVRIDVPGVGTSSVYCLKVSCNEVNICHPNAHCVLSTTVNSTSPEGDYTCQCNDGYVGDGFQCATEIGLPLAASSESPSAGCDVRDTCGPDATCVYDDEALKSVCVCNDGYRGDGILCTPIGNTTWRNYITWPILKPIWQMDVTPCPTATPTPNVCSATGSSGSSANAIRTFSATGKVATAPSKVYVFGAKNRIGDLKEL